MEKTMQLSVLSGDVSQIHSDALLTAINSGGMWFGGIDGVIQRAAGQMFHSQAARQMPLQDGQAIVARRTGHHNGQFTNVVFVVDDLHLPLDQIVFAGLKAAAEAGFGEVTLPTIRMGVMLGAVEKTKEQAVLLMATAVKRFQTEYPDGLDRITFVVFRDSETEGLLRRALVA